MRLLQPLPFSLIDTELPAICYQTEGSVGIDLVARETVKWRNPFESRLVPLNVIIHTPDLYATLLLPRSSLFSKSRLLLANSVGVIDKDYCGENDEIMAHLIYVPEYGNAIGTQVDRGDRICQLLLTRVDTNFKFEYVPREQMGSSRGGFGSTGGYNHG